MFFEVVAKGIFEDGSISEDLIWLLTKYAMYLKLMIVATAMGALHCISKSLALLEYSGALE